MFPAAGSSGLAKGMAGRDKTSASAWRGPAWASPRRIARRAPRYRFNGYVRTCSFAGTRRTHRFEPAARRALFARYQLGCKPLPLFGIGGLRPLRWLRRLGCLGVAAGGSEFESLRGQNRHRPPLRATRNGLGATPAEAGSGGADEVAIRHPARPKRAGAAKGRRATERTLASRPRARSASRRRTPLMTPTMSR